jgi:predicted nucleic acid-binding protein
MRAKVVDASVLGALVFEEPRADEAAELLAGAKLHAPFLLAYELASIARRKVVLYPDRSSVILAALEDGLAIELEWMDVDHPAALVLALRHDLTTYDAQLSLSRADPRCGPRELRPEAPDSSGRADAVTFAGADDPATGLRRRTSGHTRPATPASARTP